MRKAEAEYFVEQASARRLDVGFTQHFWEEAEECAPGLTKNDVYRLLRNGRVFGAPVPEHEMVCHKVKVRGTLPDFGLLEIVIAISYVDSLTCITIYDIEQGGE
jgi:hypothetical protein